ncbi:hypothetical protein CHS0354_034040 [Potamilus streckersoni]|uniref:Uncharacterized protein n=1 Tax=Potamilus streckersoni TaxID=2493646 RepID=A0AAE0T1G5_9BIVA|nr:hypothetical protein CHS0354_034040 [Potamilus streckersoni]
MENKSCVQTTALPYLISVDEKYRSDGKNTTACFAKPGCDSFKLMCLGDQKIQITGAEYRYIHNTTNRARDMCCPLNINDGKANYSYTNAVVLFKTCSGKTGCFENRAPTPKENERQPWNVDKYIHVSYDCILDENIIDMCQVLNRQAAEIDIIFQGTLASTNAMTTCVCYVQSQPKIYYELIDVRLFTNVTTDGAYICLNSTFMISESLIKCHHDHNDRSFIYMNSPEFTGEISAKPDLSEVLRLTFTQNTRPEMVWVKFRADNSFKLYCNSRPMTTSTGSTITEKGKDDKSKSVPIIIGVVVAAIVVTAVVAVALIMLRRRQRMHTENNTHISDLPNLLINHTHKSCKVACDSNADGKTTNYESISDDSSLTYSQPIKKSIDIRGIHESTKKFGEISAGEYDRIEFEMNNIIKSSNYDFLPAEERKVGDDTYSYVSNQPNSLTTAKSSSSDYSHCTPCSNDTLRNYDDYAHVDLERQCKNNQQPKTYEDSSYSHIDFDDTKHPLRNGKTIIDENESELKKISE